MNIDSKNDSKDSSDNQLQLSENTINNFKYTILPTTTDIKHVLMLYY